MGNRLLSGCSNDKFDAEKQFLQKRGIDHQQSNVSKWRPEQITRLRRIMSGDATKSNPIRDNNDYSRYRTNSIIQEIRFEDVFGAFLKTHPQWDSSCSDVALFFRSYPHIPNICVIRRQMSGLCFMLGPTVLQHFLVALFQGKDYELKMIDVASYIRNTWRGDALLQYLLHDNGGSSLSFMREINRHVELHVSNYMLPSPSSTLFASTCQEIMDRLEKRPALVSNFHIDDNFMRGGVSFLTGQVDHKSLKGMHAMVLIGCRKTKEGSFVFLMQNWWHNRYFIEVSDVYFESARCAITFIDSDISYIPDSFPVVYDQYAETNVDICERMNEI